MLSGHGNFSNIIAALFLSAAGKQTPMLIRMSTVVGERGSSYSARDMHGLVTRFYMDEANFGEESHSGHVVLISRMTRS